MLCAACGHDNPEAAKFCGECASSLAVAVVCPQCGESNVPGQKFCNGCATPLTATTAATTPTPTPSPALPNAFAAGRYQVKGFLGEGGRKRVYLAHDEKLDRDVAFAVIKTEGLDADGLVRVRREAQAMGRLGDHPHIVTVFDTGDENGQPFIVSQYMAGGAVEDLLRDAAGHRLPADQTMRIGEQVCRALEHAHSRGIVHRDLKPGNVWLTSDGTAQLGDFGLAVALDRSRMTMAGMMVGTVAYMSPEAALGRQPDARSDLYSLGAMLYEMAAGRPPFLGDDAIGVISQHINTAPVAPAWHNPEVPKPLDALVLRLLSKAPEERPASADEVAAELRRILARSTEEPVAQAQPQQITDLRGLSWGRFVGRRDEMDQLKSALESSLSGRLALAFIAGEPGIGKTRLAEEFAVYAGLRGAQVLTGHCYEGEASMPYRPFVEALRQYVRSRPDADLRQQLGPGAPEVATLVSEVRERFPEITDPPTLEPDAERLRLFDSVTQLLRNATSPSGGPLVLFLDDLHWADKPSLLMLQHIARYASADRLLVLASYRDVELDRTHPLSEALTELRRLQGFQRVLLRGLAAEQVEEFLIAMDPSEEGEAVRHALAQALYQETEGNPFFIREVLAHLIETGKIVREGGRWVGRVQTVSDLGIPEGVREVIGRRLSRLSDGCNRLLTAASTMTGGFAWEALKALSDEPEARLLEQLEEALAAQLIAERRDAPGTYDFTHALIRQTLYGELSTPRRVLLHRQIGEALEKLYANNPEPHLAELAHHFYQAAPGGDVDRAIDYARRAGERAAAVLAHEDGVQQYALALQALQLRGQPDERVRCALLLALGEAQRKAGALEESAANLTEAFRLADRLGDTELIGAAALNYAFTAGTGALMGHGTQVPLLRRALEAAGEQDTHLRGRLLSALSGALMIFYPRWQANNQEREALALEAKALGERIGDTEVQADALARLMWCRWGPEHVRNRLTSAAEIISLAEQSGNVSLALAGRFQTVADSLLIGDMATVDAEIERTLELAERTREKTYAAWPPVWRAMRACMGGRYAEAEALALELLSIGQTLGNPGYLQTSLAQLFDIRSNQGRAGELEAGVKYWVEQQPDNLGWLGALPYLYSLLDRKAEAHEWFEKLAAKDFTDVPQDPNYLVVIAVGAWIARYLGDARRAAMLYDMILPYNGLTITVNNGGLCVGAASSVIGLLAATMGRLDEAESHYLEAISMNERIGARTWLGRVHLQYAELLAERDQPGDRQKALEQADLALAIFQELGAKQWIEPALAVKLKAQGIESSGVYTSIDRVAASVHAAHPDLASHAAPDGTVTIMFSDIEGSTALTERLGDKAWMDVLRGHNATIRDAIKSHGGFEVKSEGDGFMIAFQSARRALDCAVAIQKALAQRSDNVGAPLGEAGGDGGGAPRGGAGGDPIRVRIGLHTGEAIKEGEDFFGKNVILAARVASQAKGGEILVSALLKALVDSAGDIPWGAPRTVELKGLSGPHEIWPVAWTA